MPFRPVASRVGALTLREYSQLGRASPPREANNNALAAHGRAGGGRPTVQHGPRRWSPPEPAAAFLSSTSGTGEKKKALDRDFIVSVLESSTTKRDAKDYLQKYTGRGRPGSSAPAVPLPAPETESEPPPPSRHSEARSDEALHIAIVKIRQAQSVDDCVMAGVAKTLCQLRALGLLCAVVVDCGSAPPHSLLLEQTSRLARLIGGFGKRACLVYDAIFSQSFPAGSRAVAGGGTFRIQDDCRISESLRRGMIPIIAPTGVTTDPLSIQVVDASISVLALVRHFAVECPGRAISVERIIILDPLGGPPMATRPGSCHRLVNLRQEFDTIVSWLDSPAEDRGRPDADLPIHSSNLRLAHDVLAMLPPASSVVITTPSAAAHVPLGSTVQTRAKRNPLIHNLLTDRPIYSPSLPPRRIQGGQTQDHLRTTVVKSGVPLFIYPDPRVTRWVPPPASSQDPARQRLTDVDIDLDRLVHLINDSFGKKLDVAHYLDRVSENLAGVVVAGDYEGGAVLTWEKPRPSSASFVPYLDKFAVLKSRQGSAGVADIVFNSIGQDCFPDGFCWRSRKSNPVNRWYFERSSGSLELQGTDWAMFWTNPDMWPGDRLLQDCEDVCRRIRPSWSI